ncbi:MAG: hypothetical protein IJU29_04860, partial [Oscillospiraceae bacterium]|nr:hypothetical protein [Oscillospiraceae bacterium]
PRTLDGKFCARLRCKNLEIHKVFLRFSRLGGHKICSPTAHVDLISASLTDTFAGRTVNSPVSILKADFRTGAAGCETYGKRDFLSR